MCMSLEALVLFLNLIGPELVTTSPDSMTVNATEGTVVWEPVADQWCTDAPQTQLVNEDDAVE